MSEKQRDEYDCALAAIATVVGVAYDDLWSSDWRAHAQEHHGIYGDKFREALKLACLIEGDNCRTVYVAPGNEPIVRAMLPGRRALLQVPSLNNEGATHLVAWMGNTLHDPSNKQIYRWLSHCFPQCVWLCGDARGEKK